jgi:protein SCO1/2
MRVKLLIFEIFLLASLFTPAARAKSVQVDGIVLAVDSVARTMLVSHRPVAGFMGGMAMPFRVEDASELEGLYPGVRVGFELVILKDRSFARHIRRSGEADAVIPPPKEKLKVGKLIPDFRLIDEQGKIVSSADLRGKVVALNFIYTRCPLPDVCPRLSAAFALLQKRLQSRDVVLLSITVDPDYDTPSVLAEYARRWGAVSPRWRFLTGDVAPVAALFGEVYWSDEGSIGHNSTTSVIDRDGRLAASVEGSSWRADQLERLIFYQLEKTKP